MNQQNSGKTLRTALVVGAVLVIAGILALTFWLPSPEIPPVSSDNSLQTSSEPPPATVAEARERLLAEQAQNNIAFPSPTSEDETSLAMPDPDRLFEALAEIRLAEDGSPVLDNRTLEQLNSHFDSSSETMTEDQIIVLQALIREGLPQPSGDQVATIIGDFNRYIQVRNALTPVPDDNLQAAENYHSTLKQLRREIMGTAVADKLFHKEEAVSEYMFAARAVEQDDSLTGDEKMERLAEIQQRHLEASVTVENWTERYARYQQEKQQIEDAALAPADKNAQIKALTNRHFNPEEAEELRREGILDSQRP